MDGFLVARSDRGLKVSVVRVTVDRLVTIYANRVVCYDIPRLVDVLHPSGPVYRWQTTGYLVYSTDNAAFCLKTSNEHSARYSYAVPVSKDESLPVFAQR